MPALSLKHGQQLKVGGLGVVLCVERERRVVRAVHVLFGEPRVRVGEAPRLKRTAVGVIEASLQTQREKRDTKHTQTRPFESAEGGGEKG